MLETGPRVLNRHRGPPPPRDSVFVGRPSKWGNPYVIGRDGSRDRVIDLYRRWLFENPALVSAIKPELQGRDLVCFCAPKACHADVLLVLANAPQA